MKPILYNLDLILIIIQGERSLKTLMVDLHCKKLCVCALALYTKKIQGEWGRERKGDGFSLRLKK